MTMQQILATFVLALSAAALLAGFVLFFVPHPFASRWRSTRYYVFFGLLLCGILLLCLARAAGSVDPQNGTSFVEAFTGAFSSALQLFTLDATLSEFVAGAMQAFGGGAYLFYILSVMYTPLAPIAGGCVIISLINPFLPRLRLWAASFKRTKYVFSELNERSIVLAEDIAERSWNLTHRFRRTKQTPPEEDDEAFWLKRMTIVFTDEPKKDSKDDDKDDDRTKLLDRAKRIGAICLSQGVLERQLYFASPSKKVVYFLIDTDVSRNLDAAVSLLTEKRILWKRTVTENAKTRIRRTGTDRMSMYVFTQNPEANPIIEDALSYNCEKFGMETPGGYKVFRSESDADINVKVVNEYRNLVYRLLDGTKEGGAAGNYPLFWHFMVNRKLRKEADAPSAEKKSTPAIAPVEEAPVEEAIAEVALAEEAPAEETPVEETPEEEAPAEEAPAEEAPAEKRSSEKNGMTIAVIGGGRIAREFFKACSWCGLMLDMDRFGSPDDNAASSDGTENSTYPTIRLKMVFLAINATNLKEELIFDCPQTVHTEEKQVPTEVNLTAEFYDAVFGTEKFQKAFCEKGLDRADYVLVALGNDDLNLQAANWVQCRLSRRLDGGAVSIHFAIENYDLYKTLASRYSSQKNTAVRMHPFCTLAECFRYESIRMDKIERRAQRADCVYRENADRSPDNPFDFRRAQPIMQFYSIDSSVATALHYPYKIFSVSPETLSVSEDLTLSLQESQFDEAKHRDHIYWLEHKRWVAYLLSQGYSCPTALEFVRHGFVEHVAEDGSKTYTFRQGGHKNNAARLHGCLVGSGAYYTAMEEILRAYADHIIATASSGESTEAVKNAKEAFGDGTPESLQAFIAALQKSEKGVRLIGIVGYMFGSLTLEELKSIALKNGIKNTEIVIENVKNVIGQIKDRETLTLRAFLVMCFPDLGIPKKKGSRELRPIDDLERLGLLIMLFSPDSRRCKEFKRNDVLIFNDFLRDDERQTILKCCETWRKDPDAETLTAALEQFYGKTDDFLFPRGLHDGNAAIENFLPVAATEEGELILVVFKKDAIEIPERHKGKQTFIPIGTSGKALFASDEQAVLLTVPYQGTVCAGRSDGKKMLHLYLEECTARPAAAGRKEIKEMKEKVQDKKAEAFCHDYVLKAEERSEKRDLLRHRAAAKK